MANKHKQLKQQTMRTGKSKLNQAEQIAHEKAIVVKIQSGTAAEKEAGFNQLYKNYKARVLQKMSIATRFNNELAKDLTMDVFMKVHANIGSYKPENGALSTWIFTIATNRLIDYKRSEKYEVISIEDLKTDNDGEDGSYDFQFANKDRNNNGYDVAVAHERATLVANAIASIKNAQVRESIRLRYIEDLPYNEIAEKLDIPEGSAKAYVNRGRSEIKEFIGNTVEDFVF